MLISSHRHTAAYSLLEMLVVIAVLAVALPMVMAAMVSSGSSGMHARAESRCLLVVPVCVEEWKLRRQNDEVDALVLGFSQEGRLLGELKPDVCDAGVRHHGDAAVAYLVRVEALENPHEAAVGLVTALLLSFEYPAVSPAESRQSIEFLTCLRP